MLASKGRLVVTAPGNPAAGAEFSIAVPNGKRWFVIGLEFTLTTDATAGNRSVLVAFDDGANVFHRAGAAFNHAASLARDYNLSQKAQAGQIDTNSAFIAIPCAFMELGAGYRIRSQTTVTHGAADQYSAIVLLTEEWDA